MSKTVKARVLSDCHFGSCGDVVSVTEEVVAANPNHLDSNASAVKYAEDNPPPKPPKRAEPQE